MAEEEKPKRRTSRRKPAAQREGKRRRPTKRVTKARVAKGLPAPVEAAPSPTPPATSAPPSARPAPRSVPEWLRLRREIALRRPAFIRQESWRYRRIRPAWRKPKGVDSKMRLQRRGWHEIVHGGYRGPRQTRGLHPSGLREVLVHTAPELECLNPKLEAARLGGTLGARRRAELMMKAKQLGIRVLNPRGLRETIREEVS